MGTGFAKKKKEARLMQEQMSHIQSQMQSFEVTGSAGNGLVTVDLTGDGELKRIKIQPDCVDPEDVEGLELLIKSAFTDASKKLKDKTSSMPGMPDLKGLFG